MESCVVARLDDFSANMLSFSFVSDPPAASKEFDTCSSSAKEQAPFGWRPAMLVNTEANEESLNFLCSPSSFSDTTPNSEQLARSVANMHNWVNMFAERTSPRENSSGVLDLDESEQAEEASETSSVHPALAWFYSVTGYLDEQVPCGQSTREKSFPLDKRSCSEPGPQCLQQPDVQSTVSNEPLPALCCDDDDSQLSETCSAEDSGSAGGCKSVCSTDALCCVVTNEVELCSTKLATVVNMDSSDTKPITATKNIAGNKLLIDDSSASRQLRLSGFSACRSAASDPNCDFPSRFSSPGVVRERDGGFSRLNTATKGCDSSACSSHKSFSLGGIVDMSQKGPLRRTRSAAAYCQGWLSELRQILYKRAICTLSEVC